MKTKIIKKICFYTVIIFVLILAILKESQNFGNNECSREFINFRSAASDISKIYDNYDEHKSYITMLLKRTIQQTHNIETVTKPSLLIISPKNDYLFAFEFITVADNVLRSIDTETITKEEINDLMLLDKLSNELYTLCQNKQSEVGYYIKDFIEVSTQFEDIVEFKYLDNYNYLYEKYCIVFEM